MKTSAFLLLLSVPGLACTDTLFRFNIDRLVLSAALNETKAVDVPAMATGYDGSNGNGAITIRGTSSNSAVSITSVSIGLQFGSGRLGALNVQYRNTSSTSTSGTFTFTPSCGTFPGTPVNLPFNLTVDSGPAAPPPTWGHQVATAGLGDPVSMATGELFGPGVVDLKVDGPLPLTFERYYASYMQPNWMNNYQTKLAVSGSTATLTLFGGKAVKFALSGGVWTLSSTERRPFQMLAAGSGYRVLDPNTSRIYGFDGSGTLTSISDRNGNTLTVTPSQVSDGLGRTLSFTYTGSNLTKVTDQAGRSVSYEYTGGNLSAVTDANGKKTLYAYTAAGMTAETRPLGNKPSTQSFDAQGRVASQTDSLNNTMTLSYGSTVTATLPLGVTQSFTHDANLNLLTRTDPTNATSRYTYDANMRVLTVTNRAGGQLSFTHDAASGLPASFTDGTGARTQYRYTSSTLNGFTYWDLTGVSYPDGTTISAVRDPRGNVTSMTDQSGRTWQATYNAAGQMLTFTNPLGGVSRFSYGQDGMLISGEGRYDYDEAKRLIRVTNADDTVRSIEYDARGNLTRIRDERNNAATFAYDDNNNLKTSTNALGAASSRTYNTNDALLARADALGGVTRFAYDALGRVQSVTDAAGVAETYGYNAQNHLTSVVGRLALGRNAEGQLTGLTDGLNRQIQFTRNGRGQITAVTLPRGERSSFSYDAMGRLLSSTDALNRSRQWTRDSRGMVTRRQVPGGVVASYVRDALGNTTAITDPNGSIWQSSFNPGGKLVSGTDPTGQETSYTYDNRGWLASVRSSAGTIDLVRDGRGNVAAVTGNDGLRLEYVYDANNRLVSGTGLTFAYDAAGRMSNSNGLVIGRDPAGRIASVTYAPGKTVRYTYNNQGLLTQVADWVGGATAFTYDAGQQLIATSYANGVREEATYDANGRVLTRRISQGATVHASITLQRDALGRVTSAERSASLVPNVANGVLPLAYDAASQSFAATYDALGRVTRDSGRNYTWDAASRLRSYEGPNGSASFSYDALGQRISRTSGGTTQSFTLNYATQYPSIATVRVGGQDSRYYVWLPNGRLLNSIGADNSRRFYHFDESGSTILLTGDTGAVTDSYGISPFGESVSQTGSTENPFTFHGAVGVMQEGNTGLYLMRARYYDSAGARFLSRDPVRSADPLEVNPYQFVSGNPIGRVDPDGRQTKPYEEEGRYGGLSDSVRILIGGEVQPPIEFVPSTPSDLFEPLAPPPPDTGEPTADILPAVDEAPLPPVIRDGLSILKKGMPFGTNLWINRPFLPLQNGIAAPGNRFQIPILKIPPPPGMEWLDFCIIDCGRPVKPVSPAADYPSEVM